ncbi:MAG: energy transducer TonB [Pseudomonadota bacterium]
MTRSVLSVLAAVALLAGCVAPANHGPQLLSGAGPQYPPQARAAGIEGRVTVAYGISVDGRVINARVVAAEPAGLFEEAALAAVRSWRYRAARSQGRAVAVPQVTSNVDFRLDGELEYELDE